MARTITSASATEAALATGAFPRRILEIQFSTGTLYYSTENLATADGDPVNAEGRIIDMGNITQSGEPGKAGSVDTMSITFADSDQFFKNKQETAPGIQATDCFLYLWFEGTTFSTDKITDFAGTLTAPMTWDEGKATFQCTMKGMEHKYDYSIGELATTDIFPEISCTQCQNALIPIVYGQPCYRVPACVIDRPGTALLASPLLIGDDTFTINATAAEGNFTAAGSGSPITLIVGGGNTWERITGWFATGGAGTTFTITDRGSVEGTTLDTGTTAGTAAVAGWTYMTIPEADLTNPTTSRAGYACAVKHNNTTWTIHLVSHWLDSGVNRGIVLEPEGVTFPSGGGWEYRLMTSAGFIPTYPVGTSVHEEASWVYATNFLPSPNGILRVEAPATVQQGDNSKQERWLEINSDHYTTNLDNTDYNTALGRGALDDGITTVTLTYSPTQLGLGNNTIYVSLYGVASLTDPADIIEDLLTNEWLGNLPAARVNSASFTTAAAALTQQCAFALLDEKRKLHEMCAEIAHQAGCVYYWDGGQANIKKITRPMAGSVMTYTREDYSMVEKLVIEDTDFKDLITEMSGKFKPALASPELAITRQATDAITDFGIKRDEIDFWSMQYPTSVALSTEFWLEYLLESNRRITFTTWLNAVSLQPGDIITLDVDDGAGNVILNSVLAEIVGIDRTPGNLRMNKMERITITCVVKMYDYTVTAVVPSDVTCQGTEVQNEYKRSGVMYLESTGTGRSLRVRAPIGLPEHGSAVQRPVTNPADPTVDFQIEDNSINSTFPTIDCS